MRACFEGMLAWMERAEVTEEVVRLREAYLRAGIVGRGASADALHVAVATVRLCRALVSWNCRHIVNFRKIPMYNAVNAVNGWSPIAIHTPLELLGDEEEDV